MKEDCPAPKITAIREAAVAAIYDSLYVSIEMEVNGERMDMAGSKNRETILELVSLDNDDCTLDELDDDSVLYELPNASCEDMSEWASLIDAVRIHVLPDEDWDAEECVVDHAPEKATYLKQMFGIPDDYYTDVAPDPTERELIEIRKKLTELTGSSPRET